MKLGEIIDELFAEAEKGIKNLAISVAFLDARPTECVPFQQDRQRVVEELRPLLKKGGSPVGLVGAHETELNGIWELRVYYKLWGKPWETDENAPRFVIGPKAELSKVAGIAPENFSDSDIVVVAGSKPETRH